MANNSPTDYKKLFLQAEGRRRQEEERRKQAEEREKIAEDKERQERERNRRTTFIELIRFCHSLLSRPLRVETPSRSTTGNIPLPTGKYCPTRLAPWTDCSARQQKIYSSVCNYLQPTEEARARLFTPLIALKEDARRFDLRPISSEQGLENYERIAVEDHVRDIIAELCKIDAARDEFGLGDGVWFDNHTNSFNPHGGSEAIANQPSGVHHPRPDQFCIHRVDGKTNTLLTTVEYKPPHKLSIEALRVGLREMDLWKCMVRSNKITTDRAEKLKYNAERLVCSAIVQEYHVMIQEGLEYSYVTNGVARVLLRVPYDDPSTLYYFLCDPNNEQGLEEPKTSIARVLCLCLMAFRSPIRDQEWRNSARSRLPLWTTSFDHARSQIPKEVLQQIAPHSDSTNSEYVSPETSTDYQPSSPPLESPTVSRRVPTRSRASCAPLDIRHRTQSPDSSGSDSNQAPGRKRGFSQVTPSPSAQRAARQRGARKDQGSHSKSHDAQFCTQRCLFGLQTGGILDDGCPNVELHRRGQDVIKHTIASDDLVRLLKAQLDENIDRCTPLGNCGAYGAPFKLICAIYGYVVVGKGTSSDLWKEVSREAQVYQILRKAQASAVPIFLGTIDLAKTYFLHGAGEIRHMLVMGWGGDSTATMELTPGLLNHIHKSNKEIKALGIVHEDLRLDNVLWNEELGRALIIDFHRSTLKYRPAPERSRGKRPLLRTEPGDAKRLRIV
ncbi:hypothetical protein N7471_008329 [Penicillium samsonianum]|uniref:uncharacterized protein n=1 Tax=Penicillium samsonianum TaxID=1882272 RepID=UPI002549A317|nr:uncharacterized protein N7471_008329 [Penicillium samsonianum]KAJ6133114.1 hypothetical protein N7471_008329 [Penicillium samsonianum]